MSERAEINREAGELACEILRSRVWTDHAWTMHAEVIAALEAQGFAVTAEAAMPYKNRRRGRIDIVAEYGGGGRVAIELDCRKPRFNSLAKLRQFDGYRIVGLRGIEGYEFDDIDACVPMRVRFATPAHKADRRIYRPAPEWACDWKGVA